MKNTITYKILKNHLLEGVLKTGEAIKIKVDQTLTQDSTGTMVYLQLDAMNIKNIQTELSVAYVDHNTLQLGFENADDHAFIKSAAEKYKLIYSKPGNGICHQLHLENFAKPGKTLIGSDSHTPTAGGMGMLAMGAGGLDVAVGMGHGYYTFTVPKIMLIKLTGRLTAWVSAKDVILKILQTLSVKGGVGYILEYGGEGLQSLSLTDRATITNMGAELGATTSLFPADHITYDFLKRQGRSDDYMPLFANDDAIYDDMMTIDLSALQPLVAKPHSPDHIDLVKLTPVRVTQVAIGSCTNSSYTDLMKVVQILKGQKIHPDVDLVISTGSSAILQMLSINGGLTTLISAGARILESSCGPCIGMGQAPKTDGVSVRTFNRNFKGRSGTLNSDVYLVSPETAAITALTGILTDPTTMDIKPTLFLPELFTKNNSYFIYPKDHNSTDVLAMGPNIKPFPLGNPLEESLYTTVILKVDDNITTDDIMPSDAQLLPFRSNIPILSKHCFSKMNEDFYNRTVKYPNSMIIAGDNYGQGSSREHAALVPLYLGVRVVLAKSFARIHKSNLINSGILPLEFQHKNDYDKCHTFDSFVLEDIQKSLQSHQHIQLQNTSTKETISVLFTGSKQDVSTLLYGGTINRLKGGIHG